MVHRKVMMTIKSSESAQIKLRLPSPMKNELQQKAAYNNRTLNAEALNRLARSLESDRQPCRTPEAGR